MMKIFKTFILICVLASSSCKPSKQITVNRQHEYLFTVLLHDAGGTIGRVMNNFFQLHPSGPVELTQSDIGTRVVEMKVRLRVRTNDQIYIIKEELEGISNVIGVSVQKI